MTVLSELRAFVENAGNLAQTNRAHFNEEAPVIQARLSSLIQDSSTDSKVSEAAGELRTQLQEIQSLLELDDFRPVGDGRDVQPLTNGHGDEKSPPSASEGEMDSGFGLGLDLDSAQQVAAVPTNGHTEGKEHKGDELGDQGYDEIDPATRAEIQRLEQQDAELRALLASGRADLASAREADLASASENVDEDYEAAIAISLGQEYKRSTRPRRGLTSDSGRTPRVRPRLDFASLATGSAPRTPDLESQGVHSSFPSMKRVYEIADLGKKFLVSLPNRRIAIAGGLLTGAGWWLGGYGAIFGLSATIVAVRTIRKFCPPPKRED